MRAAISVIKKTMVIATALMFAITDAGAQTGTWSGKLSIQGTELPIVFHLDDNQVDSESNLNAIRNGLPLNPNSCIETIKGVNHLFQHCTTGSTAEYRTIEETIAAEVLEKIIRWVSDFK